MLLVLVLMLMGVQMLMMIKGCVVGAWRLMISHSPPATSSLEGGKKITPSIRTIKMMHLVPFTISRVK